MKYARIIITFFFILLLLLGCNSLQEKRESKNSDTYTLQNNWPKLPNGFKLGNPTGLGINSENNIVVFHRGSRKWVEPMPDEKINEPTILVLDKHTGNILSAWGENLFIMPHGLEVDKEDNIWVTDVGLHQVFKFSKKGKLLLTLGQARVPGNDASHFNLPTDIAVADNGSFYISDGYDNSRIIKFSKEGDYLFEWGIFGKKEGEFNVPHGIDLDANGNVYVADRENNRIQKFNEKGKFITQWKNNTAEQLYSVVIDNNNNQVFGIDYINNDDAIKKGSNIIRFDVNLKKQLQFGRTAGYNGAITRYHDIIVDDEGSIYVGDILGNTIQKFSIQNQ